MAKLSETQRHYFINRVECSIKEEIRIIKQKNSVRIAKATEKGFGKYIKEIGIDKYLLELEKVSERKAYLMETLTNVANTIAKYQSFYKYQDFREFFMKEARNIADKQFSKTEEGKRIAELEELLIKSTDYLYGLNNNSEIARGLNDILNPKGVKLLED